MARQNFCIMFSSKEISSLLHVDRLESCKRLNCFFFNWSMMSIKYIIMLWTFDDSSLLEYSCSLFRAALRPSGVKLIMYPDFVARTKNLKPSLIGLFFILWVSKLLPKKRIIISSKDKTFPRTRIIFWLTSLICSMRNVSFWNQTTFSASLPSLSVLSLTVSLSSSSFV